MNSTKFDISGLLRDPGTLAEQARDAGTLGRLMAFLSCLALGGAALFGFALGSFVDLRVACLDAGKMVGILVFSFVICFPTMYVFSCISGSKLSPVRLLAFGLVSMATLGCLLAALAPILWLFSVSTESVVFILVFACIVAGVALAFAYRPIDTAVAKGIAASPAGFNVWFVILVVVALQAITLVRPMLSPIGQNRSPEGKCFFVQHFMQTWAGPSK